MVFGNLNKKWEELENHFIELEENNLENGYLLEHLKRQQEICIEEIKNLRFGMNEIIESLEQYKGPFTTEQKQKMSELRNKISKRELELNAIEKTLPSKSGVYLRIILGDVNVFMPNRNDRVQYRNGTEKFKLVMNVIGFCLAAINLLFHCRAMELLHIILLVWYYCILTIREAILRLNGYHIKSWWHKCHFISAVLAGVLIVWPQGELWQLFRRQFMYFSAYISIIQCLQYGFEKAMLYPYPLNEFENTVGGLCRWMFEGFSFLILFLLISYAFQGYNAWILYKAMSFSQGASWQERIMCVLFCLLLAAGLITAVFWVPKKVRGYVRKLNPSRPPIPENANE